MLHSLEDVRVYFWLGGLYNAGTVYPLNMPRHHGGALRRLRIVNDWKRSFVAASVLDFALLSTSLEHLVPDADDKLFNLILHARDHVLHSILSSRSDFNYNLRPRRHNLVLTAKSLSITDRDFITRMIYKDIY